MILENFFKIRVQLILGRYVETLLHVMIQNKIVFPIKIKRKKKQTFSFPLF